MNEHPILFSAPMVRALLEGRKTQTRRLIPDSMNVSRMVPDHGAKRALTHIVQWWRNEPYTRHWHCNYGQPGDRLWVRETWQDWCPMWDGQWCGHGTERGVQSEHGVYYRSGPPHRDPIPSDAPVKWRPSILMPRWASRITLEVTGVRVERLQEIGADDAAAEGIDLSDSTDMTIIERALFLPLKFSHLWDSINAKRAPWASNPWVWVIQFERLA